MKEPSEGYVKAKEQIGAVANLTLDNGLIVAVRIVDVKLGYGHITYIITPVAGSGETRVRSGIELLPVTELDAYFQCRCQEWRKNCKHRVHRVPIDCDPDDNGPCTDCESEKL